MTHPLVVLAGPTGVGKTAISIPVALRLSAEIISADSRQVYRHMDVGTAKPSVQDRARVRHHMVDILNPDQVYSAGQFGSEVRTLINRADRKYLIVGGSGLYIKATVEGLSRGAERNEAIREKIRLQIQEHGLAAVHAELMDVDPVAASRISPSDVKRIERALEVYQLTGMPISRWQSEARDEPIPAIWIGLTCSRAELYRRIESRIDRMMEGDQLILETQQLLASGYPPSLQAMEGLGYRDSVRYVQGELSREELVRRFKQDSRNYAKRQLTWFRKEKTIHWIDTTQWNPDVIIAEVMSVIDHAISTGTP